MGINPDSANYDQLVQEQIKQDRDQISFGMGMVLGPGTGIAKVSKAVQTGEYEVYTLRDAITGEVKYVGRTINTIAREAAHKLTEGKEDLVFTLEKSGLTYDQARGGEQMLVDANGGIDALLNKIRPISVWNPNFSKYMDAAIDLFK